MTRTLPIDGLLHGRAVLDQLHFTLAARQATEGILERHALAVHVEQHDVVLHRGLEDGLAGIGAAASADAEAGGALTLAIVEVDGLHAGDACEPTLDAHAVHRAAVLALHDDLDDGAGVT